MVKRIQVKPLRLLCLRGVEDLASYLCYHVSSSVLPAHKQDVFQDADNIQTLVETFLERLITYFWGNVVCYQQEEVADHFLEGKCLNFTSYL